METCSSSNVGYSHRYWHLYCANTQLILKSMFTDVENDYGSCLYPSLNMYVLRCFLNVVGPLLLDQLKYAGRSFAVI